MIENLIEGATLINAFIDLMPKPLNQSDFDKRLPKTFKGRIDRNQLPDEVEEKLKRILDLSISENNHFIRLFNGDKSTYENDHSSADLGLINQLSKLGFNAEEADLVFRVSKLYRNKWDEFRGEQTYGELTLSKIYGRQPPKLKESDAINLNSASFDFSSPESYKPIFKPIGMPPRSFLGPKISEHTRLFPAQALSSLVALGATGKTSLLMSIACHVAAGKDWNGHPLKRKKVVMLFCEENEDEISRKFSAITEKWLPKERRESEDYLRVIPLLGKDVRLTSINKNQYQSTGIADKLIGLLNDFDFQNGLVILDHMQGFTAGDLNISETATAVCREANKLIEHTGCAVVMAAHISKSKINATGIEQGFAVGSLAFENATRQMAGMIPMQDEDAKRYGVQSSQKNYVWLALAKNSYGASSEGLWLQKTFSPNYNTVVYEPVNLISPISINKLTASQQLEQKIITFITNHPFITKNTIDKHAGKGGIFKASKDKVRVALLACIENGLVEEFSPNQNERLENNIPKQVKQALRLIHSCSPNHT